MKDIGFIDKDAEDVLVNINMTIIYIIILA